MADGNHIASPHSIQAVRRRTQAPRNAGPSPSALPSPSVLLVHAWRNLIELRIDDSLAIVAQFEHQMARAGDAPAAPRLREFAEVLKAVLLVLKNHDGAAVDAALAVLESRHATPPSRAVHVTECLSPREHSVLRSMSCGLSNKRIAQELQIAPETVKSHVKGIFIKLAVQTRAHAVSTAGALGLL
jgi:LuxR family transcriptional regulator, maltose regulon positive regulatory protein